jgi:hypothetical protein
MHDDHELLTEDDETYPRRKKIKTDKQPVAEPGTRAKQPVKREPRTPTKFDFTRRKPR